VSILILSHIVTAVGLGGGLGGFLLPIRVECQRINLGQEVKLLLVCNARQLLVRDSSHVDYYCNGHAKKFRTKDGSYMYCGL
jgi:hypothetical protein